VSRIDELIAQLCPKGVKFMLLSDVAETVPGLTGKTKADFSDGNARFVSYKNVFANLAVDQAAPDFVKVKPGERQNSLRLGDVIFTGSSENVEEVGMSSVVLTEPTEPLHLNSFCFALRFHDRSLLDPGFSKYLFRGTIVRSAIQKSASGVTRINISKPRFMKIRVPIPPLEVQREIARILDLFTLLEVELEAQLEAERERRRQQYVHYRDSLLTFPEDGTVRWATMGEICTKVTSGGTPSSGRTDYYGGDIPWLRTQEVDYTDVTETGMTITEAGLANSSAKWIPPHCVIVAMYGATAAKVAVNAIPLTTNQACCNLQVDPGQAEFRYVFHWVANEYERLKALGEGSQSNLNAQKVKNYPIPVPSLERQREIASILDKFDALTTDLSSGLPAEISARRQQYEYYRDRLLTFEEAVA